MKIPFIRKSAEREPASGRTNNNPQPLNKTLHKLMLYIFIPLSVAYMEILLRLLCGYQFWPGFPYALFFSFCAGFVINLISLAFTNPKISRILACVMLGILSVIFVLEYFMFTTYKFFMNFATILFGAGGIIGEFSGVFFSTIISGIPVIIAFFMPLAVFILLTRKRLPFSAGKKKARIRYTYATALLLGFVIIGQIFILFSNDNDNAAYHSEYNFDTSSRRLGILTGLGLEIRYNAFGNPHADAAFSPEEILPEPEPPAPASRPPDPQPSAAAKNERVIIEASPETIQVKPPEPVEFGYNVMDLDFVSLIAGEENSKIAAIDEYVAGIKGSRQNEYTGIFEGKNLILITAEAFSMEAVDIEMTPTLYRLIHNGFYFSDFYQPAWGGSTSSGEFSILAGLAPVSGALSVQHVIGENLCYTIGNQLQNIGYFSAAYHNGSNTYYERHRTHTNFGYSTFTAMGNGMEESVKSVWPASDLEMMQYSLPQYIDKQPFSVYYMSVSGHCLYSRSGNAMADKNWDAFPQYEQMPNAIRAYMACNLELEFALEYLVSSLEAAGIADDTVIALASDHYPYGLEKGEAWGTDRDYLVDLFGFDVETSADRDHNALIIWSGSLENEYEELVSEISAPTFSLDILPTLCNLFGVDYDSRLLVGRDVFSDTAPLIFWLDRSWKTDIGYYDCYTNTFTPAPGAVVPTDYDYVNWIRTMVNNKINYSEAVVSYDYFNVLFNPDGTVREQ